MISNQELERIIIEAQAIQRDSEASAEEKIAALDLEMGAEKVILVRLKQELIKSGYGYEVSRIEAKARGY